MGLKYIYLSTGSRSSLNEPPITSEPQSTQAEVIQASISTVTTTNSGTSVTGGSPYVAATSVSGSGTGTGGSCCLFGNILKASLKGTNTFISN